jgi:hypothetical protein
MIFFVNIYFFLLKKKKKKQIKQNADEQEEENYWEGYSEAEYHSVKPIKVYTFYFVKHIRVLTDYC